MHPPASQQAQGAGEPHTNTHRRRLPLFQLCSRACVAPPRHTCRLTKLSGPLIIQNFLAYSTTVVAVAFVGHLNQPELLSSAVLANSLYNVTGYSLLQGLASGMESLCGQVRLVWHTIQCAPGWVRALQLLGGFMLTVIR